MCAEAGSTRAELIPNGTAWTDGAYAWGGETDRKVGKPRRVRTLVVPGVLRARQPGSLED